MFSSLRNRFGIPGVLAVIALVFAMLGGAYGAQSSRQPKKSGVIITKLNQISKGVQRQLKGAAGPAGPQGPAGANGKDGAAGAQGAKGDAGLQGEKGEKGDPGDPWTAGGTLPPNATETGAYAVNATQAASAGPPFYSVSAPISFSVPLSAAQAAATIAVYVPVGDTTTEHCSAAPIFGTALDPKAESGYLCVYEARELNTGQSSGSESLITAPDTSTFNAPGPSGALIEFSATSATLPLIANGSWAVTG